jgi:hypothetical protein
MDALPELPHPMPASEEPRRTLLSAEDAVIATRSLRTTPLSKRGGNFGEPVARVNHFVFREDAVARDDQCVKALESEMAQREQAAWVHAFVARLRGLGVQIPEEHLVAQARQLWPLVGNMDPSEAAQEEFDEWPPDDPH